MELLYIYIEDDGRNIKDCEFNFSPQYRFHYDKVSNTLSMEELSNYIPDFWNAKNIKNITAIIGKNGAGKSNLVEFVTQALCGGLNGRSNRLLIWKRSGQLFSNKNVISEFELQTSQYLFNPLANVADQGIKDTLLLYFSPNIDRTISTNSPTKNFSDISTAHMSRVKKKYPDIQYHFPDIEYTQIMDTFRQILLFIEIGNTFLPKGMTIPEYLTIKLYTRGDYEKSHPTYINLKNDNENISFERELRNILLKQIFSKKVPENWDENTELDIVMQQTSYNAQSGDRINSFYKEMMQLFENSNIKCKLPNQKARRGGGWDDFTFSIRRTAIGKSHVR